MLFEMLDVDYELRLVADNKYGSKQANGTWDGMVGELTRRVRYYSLLDLLIIYLFIIKSYYFVFKIVLFCFQNSHSCSHSCIVSGFFPP